MSKFTNTYYVMDTEALGLALEQVQKAQDQVVFVEYGNAQLRDVNSSLNNQIVNGNMLVDSMNETIAKLTAEKAALTAHAVAREGKLFALEDENTSLKDENAALKLELQQALLDERTVVVVPPVQQQAPEPADDAFAVYVNTHRTLVAVGVIMAEHDSVLEELQDIQQDAAFLESDLKIEVTHELIEREKDRRASEKVEQDRKDEKAEMAVKAQKKADEKAEMAVKAQKKLDKQLRAQEEKLAAQKKADEMAEKKKKLDEERLKTRKEQEKARSATMKDRKEARAKEAEENSVVAKAVRRAVIAAQAKTREEYSEAANAARRAVISAQVQSIKESFDNDLLFASFGDSDHDESDE